MKKIKSFLFLLIFFHSFNTFSQITFNLMPHIYTGSQPTVTQVADVNNDGLNDVVVATGYANDTANDYKLMVFYQNISGTLDTIPVKYTCPPAMNNFGSICIAKGDFNNDGLTDIVIGVNDKIGVFFQNVSGTFNPIMQYYSGGFVSAVKGGDVNNDGLDDIVAANANNTNTITVFYQNSVTVFSLITLPSIIISSDDEIDIGDMNNDGLNDIVYMSNNQNLGISIYTQKPTGGFNAHVDYLPPPFLISELTGLALGDLNNDGLTDVVTSGGGNQYNSRIVIWYQNPANGLLMPPIETLGYEIPHTTEITDFNCDGINEIIVDNFSWGSTSLFQQDSTGNYSTFSLVYCYPNSSIVTYALSTGDINNDGKPDIAMINHNGYLDVLLNTTTIALGNSCTTPVINAVKADINSLIIFPNPTNGFINVSYRLPKTNAVSTFEIIDINERKVFSQLLPQWNTEQSFILPNLSNGIYLARVKSGNNFVCKRIIINH